MVGGESMQRENAWSRIRTCELLRDGTLNPTPLTYLGYPRSMFLAKFNAKSHNQTLNPAPLTKLGNPRVSGIFVRVH